MIAPSLEPKEPFYKSPKLRIVVTFLLGAATCSGIVKVPACNHATRAVAQKVDHVLAEHDNAR